MVSAVRFVELIMPLCVRPESKHRPSAQDFTIGSRMKKKERSKHVEL